MNVVDFWEDPLFSILSILCTVYTKKVDFLLLYLSTYLFIYVTKMLQSYLSYVHQKVCFSLSIYISIYLGFNALYLMYSKKVGFNIIYLRSLSFFSSFWFSLFYYLLFNEENIKTNLDFNPFIYLATSIYLSR